MIDYRNGFISGFIVAALSIGMASIFTARPEFEQYKGNQDTKNEQLSAR